jgi:hypothetical protein
VGFNAPLLRAGLDAVDHPRPERFGPNLEDSVQLFSTVWLGMPVWSGLAFDLRGLHRRSREIGVRESRHMIGLGAALVMDLAWIMQLRRDPDRHRHQDAGDDGPEARHRKQPGAEVHAQAPAGDRQDARRALPGAPARPEDRQGGALGNAAVPVPGAGGGGEVADLVFAIDSVPAIFAITPDAFIVHTSNIFAILGPWALYFALAAVVHRFHCLKYALAAVPIFIGAKIFLGDRVWDGKVPAALSLSVTAAMLAAGIAVSLWKARLKA